MVEPCLTLSDLHGVQLTGDTKHIHIKTSTLKANLKAVASSGVSDEELLRFNPLAGSTLGRTSSPRVQLATPSGALRRCRWVGEAQHSKAFV
jgi:hypothetical protein